MESTDQDIFSALHRLVKSFSPLRQKRRSIFDIEGYPSWENVVSNMLVFYFSQDEQHNFGRALFNALLRLLPLPTDIREKIETDEYSVQRERDYIDILITAKGQPGIIPAWAILIENKIKAPLYNDLKKYWSAVSASHKIGVVLSIFPVQPASLQHLMENNINFYNIIHRQLTAEMRNTLVEFYELGDDRHLLYLKDFIQNIDSHYPNTAMQKELSAKLIAFQDNASAIEKFKEMEAQVNTFVGENLATAMETFGLSSPSYLNVQSKHFYFKAESNSQDISGKPFYDMFRFYIPQHLLFRNGRLDVYFELFNESVVFSVPLKKAIAEEQLIRIGPELKESPGGGPQYSYSHIAIITEIDLRADIKEKGLHSAVKDTLRRNFFQGSEGFVQRCVELLAALIKDKEAAGTKAV